MKNNILKIFSLIILAAAAARAAETGAQFLKIDTDARLSGMASAGVASALGVGALWSLPALALLGWAFGVVGLVTALLAGAALLAYMLRLLRRRLQGFTGDTLGATQQLCELAVYLGLALSWA